MPHIYETLNHKHSKRHECHFSKTKKHKLQRIMSKNEKKIII